MHSFFKYYLYYTLLIIAGVVLCGIVVISMFVILPSIDIENISIANVSIMLIMIIIIPPPLLSTITIAMEVNNKVITVDLQNEEVLVNIFTLVKHYIIYIANDSQYEEREVGENKEIIFSKKRKLFRKLSSPIVVSLSSNKMTVTAPKVHIMRIIKIIRTFDSQHQIIG